MHRTTMHTDPKAIIIPDYITVVIWIYNGKLTLLQLLCGQVQIACLICLLSQVQMDAATMECYYIWYVSITRRMQGIVGLA